MTSPLVPNRPDGRHLAFPFHIGVDGRASTIASLDQHVRDELIQLLLTNLGERPFLPEFGGGMRRLLFEGSTDATAAMAKATITEALSRWLGTRLTVQSLSASVEQSTITVDIQYVVVGQTDVRRLRFQRNGG